MLRTPKTPWTRGAKLEFCQIAECELTVGHIAKIVKKSFQIKNKETECSDTEGTILGQGYLKRQIVFQRGPCRNMTSFRSWRSDQHYISVTENIAHCAIFNKENVTLFNQESRADVQALHKY